MLNETDFVVKDFVVTTHNEALIEVRFRERQLMFRGFLLNKLKMAYSRDLSKMAIMDYQGMYRTLKDFYILISNGRTLILVKYRD